MNTHISSPSPNEEPVRVAEPIRSMATASSDVSNYHALYYSESALAGGVPGLWDPLRLFYLIRKRWFTIMLVVMFAACAAAYYLKNTTRIYQAKSTIELSSRRPRILNQQAAVIEDPAATQQFEETLNTHLEKFKSKSLLPSVIACYRKNNPDDKSKDDALVSRLAGKASFSLLRRTRLVLVTFLDSDPVFAARACQAFAEGAEMGARTENRIASDAAVAWLEAQGKTQKQELEKAEKALFDARQEYRMDLLEGDRKTVQQAIQSFNEALVGVESQEALERELLDALNTADLKPELAGTLPAVVARAKDVEGALERWQVAITERDSLLSRCTPEHPEVKAKDKAVAQFHEQAVAALGRARSATSANVDLLKRQAENLRHKMDEQSKRASDIERDLLDREMKLAALQRARITSESSSQGVFNRIQEARLSADENTATVKLIESASVPASPASPNVIRILMLAVALGLIGGLGLAQGIETLEDHVTRASDVEHSPGVRVLAVVPHVRKTIRKDIATASFTNQFSEIAEAFAGLRSVLDSPCYRDHVHVTLVASALPEEGKTTTACNLAAAWARNGERVLLIDYDLRRPRIASIFTIRPGKQGLMEYLSGNDALSDDLTYTTEYRNLSIIASRPVKGISPAELVGSRKSRELVAWARTRYDRVILDAPPLGLVSDAIVLSGLADCVLVTARPGVSRKRAVLHTIARLRDAGVGTIAAVLTDVDMTRSLYRGYGPYYHYQKHYHAYRTGDTDGAITPSTSIADNTGEAA